MAFLALRVADGDGKLGEALQRERQHRVERDAGIERRLRHDDVGAAGERAEEIADIALPEDRFGRGADHVRRLLLLGGVHLLAAKQMAGHQRHRFDAQRGLHLVHVKTKTICHAAQLQTRGGFVGVRCIRRQRSLRKL